MAVIESDYSYRNCCNDESGKWSIYFSQKLVLNISFKVCLPWVQRDMFRTPVQKEFASPLQTFQSPLG